MRSITGDERRRKRTVFVFEKDFFWNRKFVGLDWIWSVRVGSNTNSKTIDGVWGVAVSIFLCERKGAGSIPVRHI